MSNASNQSRQDQYAPFVGNAGKLRKNRAPKMSDGAGKDPVQPNNRGDQGKGG